MPELNFNRGETPYDLIALAHPSWDKYEINEYLESNIEKYNLKPPPNAVKLLRLLMMIDDIAESQAAAEHWQGATAGDRLEVIKAVLVRDNLEMEFECLKPTNTTCR